MDRQIKGIKRKTKIHIKIFDHKSDQELMERTILQLNVL